MPGLQPLPTKRWHPLRFPQEHCKKADTPVPKICWHVNLRLLRSLGLPGVRCYQDSHRRGAPSRSRCSCLVHPVRVSTVRRALLGSGGVGGFNLATDGSTCMPAGSRKHVPIGWQHAASQPDSSQSVLSHELVSYHPRTLKAVADGTQLEPAHH